MADGGGERESAEGAQGSVWTEYLLMGRNRWEDWYFTELYDIIKVTKEEKPILDTLLTWTDSVSAAPRSVRRFTA